MKQMTGKTPEHHDDQALWRGFPVALSLFTVFLAAIWIGVVIGISVGEGLSQQASKSWCNTVVQSALKKYTK